MTQQALADALNIAKNYVWMMEAGRKPITEKMQEQLDSLQAQLSSAKKSLTSTAAVPKSNATLLPGRLVCVYGFAQALGWRSHHGDVIPENEECLEKVWAPADGRPYAGFRVEGDSMLPKIADGSIVMCDTKREATPRCIVVAKWDGTIAIKRYNKVGDYFYLTSDNPGAGRDYKIHAKDMDWCLRVVEVRVAL